MKVVIVGAGFAGLAAARELGRHPKFEVTVIDRRNYHLFQPLLYQVATAGLNPADIASPIRSILSKHRNICVVHAEVSEIQRDRREVRTNAGTFVYDKLIVATGSEHHYFGQEQWEPHAPGLKTLEGATEIRRRILQAFERAEISEDPEVQRENLRFVVVGGGPTGVELAGAIAQMARLSLPKDFRRIDARKAQVHLVEAGPRILAGFAPEVSQRALKDLQALGVEVRLNSPVGAVDDQGVTIDRQHIAARTVIWAAGVRASDLGESLTNNPAQRDRQGRVRVRDTLQLEDDPNVYAIGDLAHCRDHRGQPLASMAPVATQQGRYVARRIAGATAPDEAFTFVDKGIMATIGRNRAVLQRGGLHLFGRLAWFAWLTVHIFFLIGFRNRMAVLFQWAWSYMTYSKRARLIATPDWKRPIRPQAPDGKTRQHARATS